MRYGIAVGERVHRAGLLATLRAAAVGTALAVTVAGIGTAAASGSSSTTGLITSVTTKAPDAAAAAVLAAARTHLGQKYVYGAVGPKTFDCSGFTSTLWRTIGGVSSIPRTAHEQQAWAIPVPASQVLPGDLYFLGVPASHVGIVVGGGLVLDASASHGKVVLRKLWTNVGITFGRVPRATAVKVTGPPLKPPTAPPPSTAPGAPTTPPDTPPTTSPTTPTTPAVASTGKLVSMAAKQLIGARFQAGGNGPAYDDGDLVAAAWHKASGGVLPLDRNMLAARAKPVPATKLALGDLVIYGTAKVWHVGIYVGKGEMVDASKLNGKVVHRKVFASADLHYGRLR